MESTNVPRIKRHFGKHSFGNSIFPAHQGKEKNQHRKISRGEGRKQPLPKQAKHLTTTEESKFKLAQFSN